MRTSGPKPHEINKLLVSFRFRSSSRRVLHDETNFGIGTLASLRPRQRGHPAEPALGRAHPRLALGDEHVALPDRFTTNICFGGPDRRTAYVTLSGSGRLIAIDGWPVPGLKLNYEA